MQVFLVILFQLLGKMLAEWFKKRLEDRLTKAAAVMGPPEAYGDGSAGITQLFDTAINATPLICVAERAMLRTAKDVALERAEPLWAAVKAGSAEGVAASIPPLSVPELEAVIKAHGKLRTGEMFAPGIGSLSD
jgi:hypothetical protein